MIARLLGAAAASLLLTGCLFAPGKFDASMDIAADGRFTFTYVGEVVAVDPDMDSAAPDDGAPDPEVQAVLASDNAPKRECTPAEPCVTIPNRADREQASAAQRAELLTALRREPGFRSAEYRGDNIYHIDYQMTGTLDRSFVWPYNLDAIMIFPFVVAEPRTGGLVRMKAPGFARNDMTRQMGSGGGIGGLGAMLGAGGSSGKMSDPNARMNGTFTLTSAAEIASHNIEEGAVRLPDGRQRLVWTITPTTSQEPTATVRLAR